MFIACRACISSSGAKSSHWLKSRPHKDKRSVRMARAEKYGLAGLYTGERRNLRASDTACERANAVAPAVELCDPPRSGRLGISKRKAENEDNDQCIAECKIPTTSETAKMFYTEANIRETKK